VAYVDDHPARGTGQDLADALASVRLEGLEPGPGLEALIERLAVGELTVEEFVAAGISDALSAAQTARPA